ncbi:MAG: helix-turn-helix domain-containing protein [Candidatus Eremiobacteraeota bacterium]|nr:helix-turn-helix domain-containing protein [Candidatus Eremiobacteraeota bacterium]
MTPEQVVAFAEALSRIAAGGGGPKAFAGYLAQELGVTVLVEDAEWRHVATAGSASSAPDSVRELIEEHQLVERRLHPLRNGALGAALPIFAGETQLGWLAVFGAKLPRGAEPAIRLTASAIAVELARERGGGRSRKRTFWDRLLAGGYHDTIAAKDEATARGIALADHYVAVALETEVSDETSAAAEIGDARAAALDAFRSQRDIGIVERAATLLLVIPAEREIDVANIRTAASLLPNNAARKHSGLKLSGGVGEQLPLLSAARSAEQATNAMLIGRRILGSGNVCAYDDLGIYPLLLEGGNTQMLQDFAERTLAPLRAYDEKHQTELERTLTLYFEVGENVKTAAERLSVHRHTVFYRLRQISEICGCKLESPHDQLTLRTALAIDALNN